MVRLAKGASIQLVPFAHKSAIIIPPNLRYNHYGIIFGKTGEVVSGKGTVLLPA